ncbi:MAG: O-antigen ligase family protein [Flavobacteriales bacterium]
MKPIFKSIYPYLFLIFCFALPLDKYASAAPNILLLSLIALFPFVVNKDDFKKLHSKGILFFAVLLLYILINSILFQDFNRDITIIKKIISSLALIVLFIPIKSTKKLKKAIVFSALTCIGISLINLYWFYLNEGAFNFASGAAIDKVLIIDRLYLGFLCVLSIVISLSLITLKYNNFNKWYFVSIVINVCFILLISSRIAILLLILLFILNIFYSKKKYIYFLLGILSIIIISFSINKNLQERFFYTQSSSLNKSYIELFKAWEPRFVIWNCNYQISRENNYLIKGLGFYNTKDLLENCYQNTIKKKDKRNYFVEKRFSSHNQFADYLLSTGFVGFILFLGIFLYFFYKNKKSFFKTALLISIFSLSFIDCIFHRQLGAYIFAIILILLVFPQKENLTPLETKINE